MLLCIVPSCSCRACCSSLHIELQFAEKRKRPSFKTDQWLLERGPVSPLLAPFPAVTFLLCFSHSHPEGPQKAAGPWLRVESSQMDGAPRRRVSLHIRECPSLSVQGATPDLPTSRASRLSSAASLRGILESTDSRRPRT